jgi:fatty acid desaturase
MSLPTTPQAKRVPRAAATQVEWVTLGLFVGCALVWVCAVFVLPLWSTWGGVIVLSVALVLHSSLSHEVLHGHPFTSRRANEALAVVSPGLFIPYVRFRDTHLAHHRDDRLTDPYDDQESNYLDPAVWARLPWVLRAVLRMNNTLAGRIVLGPIISQVAFMRGDWHAIRAGDSRVLKGWAVHIPGVALVLCVVWAAPMSLWHYVLACYAALSILKIRTFLEHRAHVAARGRTVIVEDRGLLAFLFLNNNLHVVHHMHPKVAWYRLPALYRTNAARYLARNGGYRYRSYAEVFARHLFAAKDPVAHPLWSRDR